MFRTIWINLREWAKDRSWAMREAFQTYQFALAYCADCRAQAEAHYEQEADTVRAQSSQPARGARTVEQTSTARSVDAMAFMEMQRSLVAAVRSRCGGPGPGSTVA